VERIRHTQDGQHIETLSPASSGNICATWFAGDKQRASKYTTTALCIPLTIVKTGLTKRY